MLHFSALLFLLVSLVETSPGLIALKTRDLDYALMRRGPPGRGKDGSKPQQGRSPSSLSGARSPTQARSQERITSGRSALGASSQPHSPPRANFPGSPSIGARVGVSSSSLPPKSLAPMFDALEFPREARSRDTVSQRKIRIVLGGVTPTTQQPVAPGMAYRQPHRDPRFWQPSGTMGGASQQGRNAASASRQRERQYISTQDPHYRDLLSQVKSPQSASSQQQPLAQSMPPAHSGHQQSKSSAFSRMPQRESRQSPAESSGTREPALDRPTGSASRRSSSDSLESERGNQKRQRKGGE